MTEPLDVDALRRLAEAATPDPPTVLALLDALAAAQAERDAVRACSSECDGCNALVDALQAPLGVGLSDQPSRDFAEENGRLLAELAALRAQVEASTARARDAITEEATDRCNDYDCADRIACTKPGLLGHRECGTCPEHDRPRHHCGCLVFSVGLNDATTEDADDGCGCGVCDGIRRSKLPWPERLCSRMIVCPDFGKKRCPRVGWHGYVCTGSNEPGQPGSSYPLVTWGPTPVEDATP